MPPRRNAPRRDRRYSPGATPSGQEPTAYRWAGGDWGLVQWEQTIGDLLSSAGYCCAAYGKWHVGEGRGRWPTDKGFTEWYGPPRIYDEALWPTDPWYDPGRDPVSKMLSIKRGEADVTEGEQLTLDVRRDCDNEYLAKADRFIRAAVDDDTPFFCLLQPFLDAPARRSTR
jgi:arylsulfatase A-like enzyme